MCRSAGRFSLQRRRRRRRRRSDGRSSRVGGRRWWLFGGRRGGQRLDVAERYAGVERGHDEPGSKHVGMNRSEPGALADGAYPAVRGATIEALAVSAAKDRSLAAFADREVDGPGGSGHQRNGGGLVALADDVQGPVATLDTEVLDVRDGWAEVGRVSFELIGTEIDELVFRGPSA